MNEQIVVAQHLQDVARRYLRAVETWDVVVERNKNATRSQPTGASTAGRAASARGSVNGGSGRQPRLAALPAPSGRCGNDLPPCYVMMRESGGNIHAYNPTGCNGHGCYGKWQFSGAWACRLGLPCDLSTASETQQDNAARLLWDGGRGCSNWGAC